MAGGHYNYKQNQLMWLADEIEEDFENDGKYEEEDWDGTMEQDRLEGTTDTQRKIILKEIKSLIKMLRKCAESTKALDYFISGNIGIETYLKKIGKSIPESILISKEYFVDTLFNEMDGKIVVDIPEFKPVVDIAEHIISKEPDFKFYPENEIWYYRSRKDMLKYFCTVNICPTRNGGSMIAPFICNDRYSTGERYTTFIKCYNKYLDRMYDEYVKKFNDEQTKS